MRKLLCPQCKIAGLYVKNEKKERLLVYVSDEGEVVTYPLGGGQPHRFISKTDIPKAVGQQDGWYNRGGQDGGGNCMRNIPDFLYVFFRT